jgi:hypothetical protein
LRSSFWAVTIGEMVTASKQETIKLVNMVAS